MVSFKKHSLKRATLAALVLATIVAPNRFTVAQETGGPAAKPPTQASENTESQNGQLSDIRNNEPAFLVRASVDRKSCRYREGDRIRVTAASEVDGYLYAFYKQADGRIYQIFPNRSRSDNRIRARQAVALPTDDDQFVWRVGPPFGKETLKIVVTTRPLREMSDPVLLRRLFNPVDAKRLKGMGVELEESQPDRWAEYDIQLETFPAATEPGNDLAKRYGVFFGVSHYEFNAEYEIATGGESLNLPTCHRDAQKLADLMLDAGRLDDVQVYTNENATRENFEQAITGWLKDVSKPGDTVFIYFSGHGQQIPDNNGDETDDIDEVLATYETAGPGILSVMIDQYKQDRLDPSRQSRLAELLTLARGPGSDAAGTQNEIGQRLARGTGVSDDVMGHWLQSLDGRKVVVILDICYAGGFATLEKSVGSKTKPMTFDFLDREISRLKDIGQEDAILLASSSAMVKSMFRDDRFPEDHGPFSVMTSYLVQALLEPSDPISVDDAFRHCHAGMQQYFTGKPPAHRHEPILFGRTADPVYLKP